MTDSTTPFIMLALFLVGTLWLGMRCKKSSRSITEYTIGNKMFTTAALVATVVATSHGGGGLIRTVEIIYTQGLWYIMLLIGVDMIPGLMCTMIASRISLFMENNTPSKNHISMADTIGHVYGRIPRIIAALAAIGTSTTAVAIQITVTSRGSPNLYKRC